MTTVRDTAPKPPEAFSFETLVLNRPISACPVQKGLTIFESTKPQQAEVRRQLQYMGVAAASAAGTQRASAARDGGRSASVSGDQNGRASGGGERPSTYAGKSAAVC